MQEAGNISNGVTKSGLALLSNTFAAQKNLSVLTIHPNTGTQHQAHGTFNRVRGPPANNLAYKRGRKKGCRVLEAFMSKRELSAAPDGASSTSPGVLHGYPQPVMCTHGCCRSWAAFAVGWGPRKASWPSYSHQQWHGHCCNEMALLIALRVHWAGYHVRRDGSCTAEPGPAATSREFPSSTDPPAGVSRNGLKSLGFGAGARSCKPPGSPDFLPPILTKVVLSFPERSKKTTTQNQFSSFLCLLPPAALQNL